MTERQRYARYSPGIARELCALLAAGESLNGACAHPGMPGRRTVRDWRMRHPEFERMYQAAAARRAESAARLGMADAGKGGGSGLLYTPELAERICDLVAEGESLLGVSQRRDMPCHRTICRWLVGRPEFRIMYLYACEDAARKTWEGNVRIADEALGAGWPQGPDGRVSAREALAHARLLIAARNGRTGIRAPRVWGLLGGVRGGVKNGGN